MVLGSRPVIMAGTGGLMPFDLRLFGYSYAKAQGAMAALSDQGRGLYLTVQLGLDSVYPALMAVTLALSAPIAGLVLTYFRRRKVMK